jgi:hypothetical protein
MNVNIIVSINKLKINQMDIKIHFLNSYFDEKVYMEHPKRFVLKE